MKLSLHGLTTSLVLLLVTACAAPVQEQDQSGFLQDYSRLVETGESSHQYTGPNLGKYSTFMIDPVALLFSQDPDDPQFDTAELEEIKDYLNTQMTKALTNSGDYKVVDSPAPGVARFRVGITSMDASTGVYNVLFYTKVTGAGLGGVATEAELVDSITGEQLSASISWGSGSRILRAGFTPTGDAKILIGRWIKKVLAKLDEAHQLENSPQ